MAPEQSGTTPSLIWLAVLGLAHLRVQLALLLARACCWLALNSLSAGTPRLLSMEHSTASHPHTVAQSQVQNPAPILLNFMWLVIAQLYNLSRSVCKTSLLLGKSTAPTNSVLSSKLLSILLSSAYNLFIKIIKRSCIEVESLVSTSL